MEQSVDLEKLEGRLNGDAAFLRLPIRSSRERYGEEYVRDANRILRFLWDLTQRLSISWEDALTRYAAFVRHRIDDSRSFQVTGRYHHESTAQVRRDMSARLEEDLFLALLFSYVLAPHRYALLRSVAAFAANHIAQGIAVSISGWAQGWRPSYWISAAPG